MAPKKIVPVDPARAVANPAEESPDQIIGELRERAAYPYLDEPAEHLVTAFANLYAPGLLTIANSDGALEVTRVREAIVGLRKAVADVRRELEDYYSWRSASRASPMFGLACRLLAGICYAKRLEPRELLHRLQIVRLEAALTLVMVGNRAMTGALSANLAAPYLRETLDLFYAGIRHRCYPLSPVEAADNTEWFPDGQAANKHIPHKIQSESCQHCQANKPDPNTMVQRHRRLRRSLLEAIWPGLNPDDIGFARRQSP